MSIALILTSYNVWLSVFSTIDSTSELDDDD